MIDIVSPPVVHAHTLVALRGVTVRYGERLALRDIHLDIPRAAVTRVIGANGSGKSTLLSAVVGAIAVEGVLERPAAMTVAFVAQRSAVPDRLPLTVRDVVEMGRWASQRRGKLGVRDNALVAGALDALQIGHLAERPLSELSGGQRQRALVAQGLAREADLVVLDEPTAGIDAEARDLIRRAIDREVDRGAAVLLATHDDIAGERHGVVRLVDGCRVPL